MGKNLIISNRDKLEVAVSDLTYVRVGRKCMYSNRLILKTKKINQILH